MANIRIGQGFDVHAFAFERRLIIGGVEIAHERGLAGHSDADVLLHAICDALLGAAGLGDIGQHYPDSDPKWADVNSRQLLRETVERVAAKGFCIFNIDATILAEAPRMAPHIPRMVANISEDIGILESAINIKATTTERLGFVGRAEGIAAQAVCLIGAAEAVKG